MARRVRGQGSVRFRDGRWEARIQLAPGDRRTKSFASEAAAWDWIAETKTDKARGVPQTPATPAAPGMRFDDLVRLYKVHRAPRWTGGMDGGSAQEFDSHAEGTLIPAFGKRAIGSITTADIQQFIDSHIGRPILHRFGEKKGQQTGRTLSPTTVNKYLRILRAVFRYAVKMQWLDRDPTAPVERDKRKRKKQRSRVLRLWELQAILANCTARHRLFLTFLAFTGLRRSEAARCAWEWVDLDRRELRVLEPKVQRDEPDVIPMPDRLVALLAAIPQRKRTGYVFPGRWRSDGTRKRVTGRRGTIRAACVLAGVDPVRVAHHSFRYTFASLLEEFGAPRGVVRALMRHDPDAGEMTDVYVQPTPEQLSAAVDVLANRVLGPPVAIPIRRSA